MNIVPHYKATRSKISISYNNNNMDLKITARKIALAIYYKAKINLQILTYENVTPKNC